MNWGDIEPVDDPLLEQLQINMGDGLPDVWQNVPTQTIQRYTDLLLLSELEELHRRIKRPESAGDALKILDQRILQLVGRLKGLPEEL